MLMIGIKFMVEYTVVCLVIGFVSGYVCNRWRLTKKAADKLDEVLGNKNN